MVAGTPDEDGVSGKEQSDSARDDPGCEFGYGFSGLADRSKGTCAGLRFLGREPSEAGKDNDRSRLRWNPGGDRVGSDMVTPISKSMSMSIFMEDEEERLRGSEVRSEEECCMSITGA